MIISLSLSLAAMSVDVLISPRISFSHDLREAEHESSVPLETYPYPSPSLDTGFDFDFAFIVDSHGALIRESSTADQLFSDGKLLPISIDFAPNGETTTNTETGADSTSPVFPCFETEEKKEKKKKIIKSLKEHLEDSIDIEEGEGWKSEPSPAQAVAQQSAIRTFWKFGRSNSLNGSSYGRNRGKLNIPSKLRLLSRSKSTGGGVVSLMSAKPVKEEDEEEEEEETKPGLLSMVAGRSLWKIILLRSSSTGEVLANRKMENTSEEDKEKGFGIRRSCSLKCDGYGHGGGLIVGRSESTGSTSNLKKIGANNGKKELLKQNSAKYPPSSSSCNAKEATTLKRGGRRSFRDYYGDSHKNGRVNSVLNLPSPYISRVSVDLLGFGSLFCSSSKSRKVKK